MHLALLLALIAVLGGKAGAGAGSDAQHRLRQLQSETARDHSRPCLARLAPLSRISNRPGLRLARLQKAQPAQPLVEAGAPAGPKAATLRARLVRGTPPPAGPEGTLLKQQGDLAQNPFAERAFLQGRSSRFNGTESGQVEARAREPFLGNRTWTIEQGRTPGMDHFRHPGPPDLARVSISICCHSIRLSIRSSGQGWTFTGHFPSTASARAPAQPEGPGRPAGHRLGASTDTGAFQTSRAGEQHEVHCHRTDSLRRKCQACGFALRRRLWRDQLVAYVTSGSPGPPCWVGNSLGGFASARRRCRPGPPQAAGFGARFNAAGTVTVMKKAEPGGGRHSHAARFGGAPAYEARCLRECCSKPAADGGRSAGTLNAGLYRSHNV